MPIPYQLPALLPAPDSQNVVSRDHFGVNTLLSYTDLKDPDDPLSQSLAEMSPGRLRYPGGAITETYSDQIMDHVLNGTRDPSLWQGLENAPLFLDDILTRAAEMNAAVSIVIPTVTAFESAAAPALDDGSYGARGLLKNVAQPGAFISHLHQFASAVSVADQAGNTIVAPNWNDDYIRQARQFVSNVMQLADDAEVKISAFEIGNEFWGSGEMTASEYGELAGTLANALAWDFENNTFAGYRSSQSAPELLVQSLAAAGTYSPNGPRTVDIDGETYVIPSQGGAASQNRTIIAALNSLGAGDNIDGVVNHYYDKHGLQGVDNTAFVFRQLDRWADDLVRSEGLPELSFQITEWDVGTGDPDNGGLQQAQMLLEQFYNMMHRGVDAADIWPLHFYKVQGTSLTDDGTQALAMGGEIFRLMSESLVGLSPVLDWDVSGEIDVHGYADDQRLVLFVAERSGQDQTNIEIDLTALGLDSADLIQATSLSNNLPDTIHPDTGKFANGLPVIQSLEAVDIFSESLPTLLEFDMEDWSILQLEFALNDAPNLRLGEATDTSEDQLDFANSTSQETFTETDTANETTTKGASYEPLSGAVDSTGPATLQGILQAAAQEFFSDYLS